MKVILLALLALAVPSCAFPEGFQQSQPAVSPTPDLLQARRVYRRVFQESFETYSISVALTGPSQDVLKISHKKKEPLMLFAALLLNKPEVMDQLKERQFQSIHFTDGYQYDYIVPVE